jgi:hypothetical protein
MPRQLVKSIKAHQLKNFIDGLTLKNEAGDLNNYIEIKAGVCADSTNSDYIVLNSPIVKRLNATWVAGSGVGGLDTGVKAASTSYHVFVIKNPTTNVTGALISLSATAPTLPSGYTLFRRVGSILTDSSSNIRQFVQKGDVFNLNSAFLALNAVGSNTSGAPLAVGCPTGVSLEVFGHLGTYHNGDGVQGSLAATDGDTICPGPSMNPNSSFQYSAFGVGGGRMYGDYGSNHVHGTHFRCTTNINGQLSFRSSSTGILIYFYLMGWRDNRGKE